MKLPLILDRTRYLNLLLLVVIGLAQAGVTVAIALQVRILFDGLIDQTSISDEGAILKIGAGLVISACLLAWLRMQENVSAERLGQSYILDARTVLFRQLCRLSARAVRNSHGSIFIRFVGDLSAIRRWVSLGLARLIVASVLGMGVLGALAFVAPLLALTVLAVIGLGALGLFKLGLPMQAAVREARRQRSRLAANISDKISAFAVMQAFGQIRRERLRMQRDSGRLSRSMVRQALAAGKLRAVTELTTILTTAAVLVTGSLAVFSGAVSVGTVVAAMAIVGMLTSPLRDLGRTYEYWRTAEIAREKIRLFLQQPVTVQQVRNAAPLAKGPGRVTFQQVGIKGAINNISVELGAGGRVAVVGPNGAGKSTLLGLVARLFDPDQGKVLIDGKDIRLVTLKSLREKVSMVSPDLPLLRGSINRNLRYRSPNISRQEFEQICQLCGVSELLGGLPHGLHTRLSGAGLNLSVGQRQRLALARALVGRPRILLLDEADANLDPETQKIVERIIADFSGSVLLITHRLEMLRKMDQIWHLEHGRLVEVDSPQQLLDRPTKTRRLFLRLLSSSSPDITSIKENRQ